MKWNDILNHTNEFYFKSPFWKKISPFTKLSAYLAFEYINKIKENNAELTQPFFISVPDKTRFGEWLSSVILLKKFYDEYTKTGGDPGIKLVPGRKYSVFGSICIYDGTTDLNGKKRIKLVFANNVTDYIQPAMIKKHINEIPQDRRLNKVQHFRKLKSELVKEKPALSRILEPGKKDIVNEEILQSKILFVYGRGNKEAVESDLKDTRVYDEPLYQVLTPNNNLILNADLRKYIGLNDDDYNKKLNRFKEALHKLSNTGNVSEEVRHHLIDLIGKIEQNNDTINEEIDEDFIEIIDNFGEEDSRLENIKNNFYPGITPRDKIDFDAVILNDVYQAEDYKNTIGELLKRKIPVIVICNKEIITRDDIILFSRFFNDTDGFYRIAYRFNWTKSKILRLTEKLDVKNEYLDKSLVSSFVRFAKQTITITWVDKPAGPDIDKILPDLKKKSYELQGYENLKNAIYQVLYPFLYILKNSHSVPAGIIRPIFKKFMEFSNLENFHFREEESKIFPTSLFDDIINNDDGYKNSKNFGTDNVFCQKITIPDMDDFHVPVGQKTERLPSRELEKILFTGFPYKELTTKYLIHAVTKYFIPKIEIICWPEESRLTYNYLKRRLKASYFTDLTDGLVHLEDEFKITDNSLIDEEIDRTLKLSQYSSAPISITEEQNQEDNTIEDILQNFENMRYEKYKSQQYDSDTNSGYSYIVKSNIVLFDDGCFMFIPENSTILTQLADDASISIKKLKFKDLKPGMRIYQIKGENISFRNLLNDNKKASEAYKIIDIWRNVLSQLLKKFGNIEKLSKALMLYGKFQDNDDAKPSYHNIIRWLSDNDMIAPNESNLRLIIEAGRKNGFAEDFDENKYNELMNALKYIKGLHISLGRKLRESLIKYIMQNRTENEFILEIAGVRVQVLSKKIAEINDKTIEVEYSYTRKFLC